MKQKINPWLKWGCLTPIALFFALILGVILLDAYMPSPDRRALPGSASEVQEYHSSSWNGDFLRCIKAKLPESNFPTFARNLGLTQRFDPVRHAHIAHRINVGVSHEVAWFTPPLAGPKTYFKYDPSRQSLMVLTFSDGYVYYLATMT